MLAALGGARQEPAHREDLPAEGTGLKNDGLNRRATLQRSVFII